MREVKTSLEIHAPPDAVWEQLLDKSRWGRFSDFCDLDPGRPIAAGATFTFGLKLLGLPAAPIRVRVLRFEPPRELCWVGAAPGFRGEHYFRIDALEANRCRLTHGEYFSGPLGSLYDRLFHTTSTDTYAAFNVGLAMQAERFKES
ncbi:MAG: SRPBCC domain-containing protein [bacterium]